MVSGDFELWAWASWERLWASSRPGSIKTVVLCGDASRITRLWHTKREVSVSLHKPRHTRTHANTCVGLVNCFSSLFSSVRMAVIDWWNGPLSLVVIFFALCLLLLTWRIAGVACRACYSSGSFFRCDTHTHTHTHAHKNTHAHVHKQV